MRNSVIWIKELKLKNINDSFFIMFRGDYYDIYTTFMEIYEYY